MIDLLRTRRSIRKYSQKRAEKKWAEVLMKAWLRAPTSGKRKPWELAMGADREPL